MSVAVHHAAQSIDPVLITKLDQLRPFIGNTPLFPLHDFVPEGVQLFAKLEWQQYGGSVKSRPAFAIFERAIRNGFLAARAKRSRSSGQRLLDASSGNTAIAYAHIGRALGIGVTIVLPENASIERKEILKTLGVDIIYSSPYGGTDEAQQLAKELAERHPEKYYYADQYNNPANIQAHSDHTAQEIWDQTSGDITHFITGLGTTGTFTGTSLGLRSYSDHIQHIALQPETALHGLEGWKHLETAKVPGIYDPQIVDVHRAVSTEDSYHMLKRAVDKAGLLLSPSAAAALSGAVQLGHEIESGTIVTVFADNAEKYSEVYKKLFHV